MLRHIGRYRLLLSFLALLVFCSVMVVRQHLANQNRQVELREAFIVLYTKGYKPEAERLYQRLIQGVYRLPDRALWDDFQRTVQLVDPMVQQPHNLIWNYHWTVSKELDRRSESVLPRALKLAREKP